MFATKPYLTQADVQKILNAADAHAAKNNLAVTIAVCDDGGHLLGLIRDTAHRSISHKSHTSIDYSRNHDIPLQDKNEQTVVLHQK